MTERNNSKFPQTCCLTFVDNSEHDLPVTAVHIRPVAHLADVGAVKGGRHINQSDGGVPFQNITWPLHVTLETTFLGRIRHLLEVEDLE